MMSEPTLEQIAEQTSESEFYCAKNQAVLAREIIALREATDERVTKLEGVLLLGAHATTARLDSHNSVMVSIVHRVRALEGGGVECTCGIVPQPPGPNHGPRCPAEVAPKTIELLRGMVDRAKQQQDKAERAAVESHQRAETAERERDEWKAAWQNSPLEGERDAALAKVERLREALSQIVATPGGEHRGKGRDRYYALNGYERVHAIATAALGDA